MELLESGFCSAGGDGDTVDGLGRAAAARSGVGGGRPRGACGTGASAASRPRCLQACCPDRNTLGLLITAGCLCLGTLRANLSEAANSAAGGGDVVVVSNAFSSLVGLDCGRVF